MESPRVFISYSWDDDLHKNWVVTLTNRLREKGITTNLDRGVTNNDVFWNKR